MFYYLYRLRGEENGEFYETLNVFNDDGSHGKYQKFYPILFL